MSDIGVITHPEILKTFNEAKELYDKAYAILRGMPIDMASINATQRMEESYFWFTRAITELQRKMDLRTKPNINQVPTMIKPKRFKLAGKRRTQ